VEFPEQNRLLTFQARQRLARMSQPNQLHPLPITVGSPGQALALKELGMFAQFAHQSSGFLAQSVVA
jgi:hypothetical protein